MKKEISVFIFFAVCLIHFGCNKQLNTSPQTSISQLTTLTQIQDGLAGCYSGFQTQNYLNSPGASGASCGWSAIPDLMGDDFVEDLASLGNWRFLSEMSYAADNSQVQGLFAGPYEVISRANNVLQSLPPFLTGANAATALQIKAQSLAIRAFAHFNLMQYFAQDFGRHSSSLGVPYVTTFNVQNPFANLPSRLTVEQDYDSIYADLNNALLCYQQAGDLSSNTARNFVDSLVVHAMSARVNLYASQWSDAINDASIALNLSPLGASADYLNCFNKSYETAPPSEVIWAVPSDNQLQPGLATNGSNPNYRVSTYTSNLSQSLGGAYSDPSIISYNQSSVGSFPATLLQKYPGINSFKVFRAGEMILITAEAEAMLGQFSASLNDLNSLRANRGLAAGNETGDSLVSAIFIARRLELLGEGHRWFDLKRTSRVITRSDCGISQGSPSTACTFDSTARGWILPIPLNDITANKNLIQNPGY